MITDKHEPCESLRDALIRAEKARDEYYTLMVAFADHLASAQTVIDAVLWVYEYDAPHERIRDALAAHTALYPSGVEA